MSKEIKINGVTFENVSGSRERAEIVGRFQSAKNQGYTDLFEMKKDYCVFDGYYGDFVENFTSFEEAKAFCVNPKNMAHSHSFKIGKWVDDNNYTLLEEVYNPNVWRWNRA